jgi:two-component system, LytTR family, response regulator
LGNILATCLQFLRVHRSRIVRAACIVELSAMDNGEYLIKLTDGSQHRSSRTYADKVKKWLSTGKAT